MTLPDANYDDALAALNQAIGQFDGCSPQERAALQAELQQLEQMTEKLQSGRVQIVVFGEISTGKSALINALLGSAKTEVNVQGGWTRDVWHLPWDGCGYRVPGFAESEVVLVDTPGLNEVDGASRTNIAQEAAARADLILFVTDSDLNDTEFTALVELSASHKPILLVLNKVDLYTHEQLEKLLAVFKGPRLRGMIDSGDVILTAADPKPVEYVIEGADGSIRQEFRKPLPKIEQLRMRILEVLEREGQALVALNAAMYAADRSDKIAAMRIRMREDYAQMTIWTYASMKSLAVALNPVAIVDVLGGSAIDVAMVVTLAEVYGIRFTRSNAAALITSILKAAGWVMLSEAAVHAASSIFKGLTLGYGTVLTALPQGAAAGYGSYVVGQAARYYFQHGASWAGDAPKNVITRILDATDKESVLRQLKDEIKKKIRLNPYAGK
jgi:small GTP-binding protein